MLAELKITSLNEDRKRSASRRKVRYNRIRSADGKIETIYRIDFASEDVGSQFSKVFQSAVNKARRENKKLIGAPDIEPKRG